MNDISFGAKTNFAISNGAYDKVYDATRFAYTNLTKIHNRRIRTDLATITTDPEHITVLVKNNRDGFFRFVPLKDQIQKFIDDIAMQTEQLKETSKGENLTAWIIGGTNIESKNGNLVVKTLNRIADLICDKSDVDTSILVGSKTGEERFVLHPTTKDFTMTFDKKVDPKRPLEEELENIFDIVELNNTNLSYIS